MLDILLDLIYPPVCGVCGRLDKNSLCNKCKIQLNKEAAFNIEKNGKDINIFFNEHMYIFMYCGTIRSVLLNYKFNDNAYLYKTLTNFLLKNQKFVKKIKSYDIIIPVPLSKNRRKERGYNQSELIAKEISLKTQIKMDKTCLKKIKNVLAQSTLNKEDRYQNIEGAYKIQNNNLLKNKKVLLLDDIFTTGSTVNECSKQIQKANPKKIGVLTIAKD